MADVILQQIIPSAKVALASAYFVRERPIPTMPDPESTEENPLPDIPAYTVKKWVEICIIKWLHGECEMGRKKLEADSSPVANNLFI